MRRLQPAVLNRVAIDPMLANQLENEISRTGNPFVHAVALLGPKGTNNIVRIVPRIDRDNLPIVAARRAKSSDRGLKQYDVGAPLFAKRMGLRRRNRRIGPKTRSDVRRMHQAKSMRYKAMLYIAKEAWGREYSNKRSA
jgi:hypothetical protein